MKKIFTPLFIPQIGTSNILMLPDAGYADLLITAVLPVESNQQKLTSLYEKYYKELYRYSVCRVSGPDVALDIVQEAFQRTWQYMEKGNHIEHGKSFLYTTIRNLIIDEYRKKKSVSLELLIGTDVEPSVVIEETLYQRDEALQVIKCINQLSATYSLVLHMRYVDDSSITHIDKTLQVSENVVSVRIYRGLCKL